MKEQWIDVSAHNGAVDWRKVADSGIRGAILRAGCGNCLSQTDSRFQDNIAGAASAGLKTAVYWLSYASSEADSLREWEICKQVIQPYRGRILFVAYDYEYASAGYYKQLRGTAPSARQIDGMAKTFLNAARADGWNAVLYLNNDYRLHVYAAATLARYDLWLADYDGVPDAACAVRQTASSGKVPGVAGTVNLDTVFRRLTEAASVEIDPAMDLPRPGARNGNGERLRHGCFG